MALHYESHTHEWMKIHEPQGLHVIVVGGGVGGMSAAIALRQQGHHVQIYESSSFSRDIGAALHTPPNGNAVLKHLGISAEATGANLAQWMSEWTHKGVRVKKIDLVAGTKTFEHKWRLAHRIKLHDALRKAAIEEAGYGPPAQLHLSKVVWDIDPVNAIVYFKDGSFAKGDVIVGADGVHSLCRTKLPGGEMQPFPSGQSAFRFLVPKKAIMADSRTQKFAEDNGDLVGIFGPDRSIIIYPTSDNTILNFVCIHPTALSGSTEGWGSTAGISKLLAVYKDFHSDMSALLEKADESSLKVWRLLDMAPLPNWCHERLAVIGDAAHPFLPFLGQGASIAIEDAASIGVVLEKGLNRDEIPARLRLYQDIRKERAELVQEYTRLSGKSRGENAEFNAAQFQGYCFGHDEWENSTQKLQEWKCAKTSEIWSQDVIESGKVISDGSKTSALVRAVAIC